MLAAMPKAKGGQPYQKGKSTPDIVSGVQTLAELGLEEKQSARWQKVASIPQKLFDDWIANSKKLNTSGALRLARHPK